MWHSRSLLHTLRWLLHTTVSSPQPAIHGLPLINSALFKVRQLSWLYFYVQMLKLTWKKSSSCSRSAWPDPSTRWHVHTWRTGGGKQQVRNCNTHERWLSPTKLTLFLNKDLIYMTNMANFSPGDPDAAKLEPVRSAGWGSRGAMNRSRSAVTRIKEL